MTGQYKLNTSKLAYDGKFLKVREDNVSLGNGHTFQYELIEHPGGAAILPVDSEGMCYLVRQYRYPVDQDVLEIPAGRLENDGTSPQENAVRECVEEVGFHPRQVIDLGLIYPSPGVVQEKIYLYLGRDLEKRGATPDPGEILETVSIPYKSLQAMVKTGEITDAKTALAVIRAEEYLS